MKGEERDGGFSEVELSVVVPTYNEAENIGELIELLEESLKGVSSEILVVDDSSPDGTAEVVKKLAERYQNVRLIVRSGERSLSRAVVEGFKASRGRYLVVIDADLQHPPSLITELFRKALEGYDIVIASRYVEGGGTEGWSLWRRLVSKLAVKISHIALPQVKHVKDPVSGFFLVNKERVLKILGNLNPVGFKILLELLVKTEGQGTCEVPYVFKPRRRGESKLKMSTVMAFLKQVFKLFLWSGEYKRVLKFALVGLSGLILGELLLWALTSPLGLYYLASAAIATEISIINNFVWNEVWTFRDKRRGDLLSVLKRLAKFNALRVLTVILTVALTAFFTEVLKVLYLVSFVVAVILAFAINYLVSSYSIWG